MARASFESSHAWLDHYDKVSVCCADQNYLLKHRVRGEKKLVTVQLAALAADTALEKAPQILGHGCKPAILRFLLQD